MFQTGQLSGLVYPKITFWNTSSSRMGLPAGNSTNSLLVTLQNLVFGQALGRYPVRKNPRPFTNESPPIVDQRLPTVASISVVQLPSRQNSLTLITNNKFVDLPTGSLSKPITNTSVVDFPVGSFSTLNYH